MKWLLSILLIVSSTAYLAHEKTTSDANESRIILVTGSTGGLGREVARALVAMGDQVIIHGRNIERGKALEKELNNVRKGSARFFQSDFSSLKNVDSLASDIMANYEKVDVLVNNAGIALINNKERLMSDDDYELHFQINYLAGYHLAEKLMPLILKSDTKRIVNVSSGAAAPIDFNNIMLEDGYSPWRAYGQSKLAQVMHTIKLTEKYAASGLISNALHPSTFMDTDMVTELGFKPESSVKDGRDAVLKLINDTDIGNGQFFDVQELSKAHEQAYDMAVRNTLWDVTQKLIADKLK